MGGQQSKGGLAQVERTNLVSLQPGPWSSSLATNPSLEVVTLQDVQVLALAYEANSDVAFEGSPRQHIRFTTSDDGGLTWAPSRCIVWGMCASWGPALLWDERTSRLVLFYSESRKSPSRGGDVKMVTSPDLGESWTAPVTLYSHEEEGEVPKVTANRPAVDTLGVWHLPVHLEPEGSHLSFNLSTVSELEGMDEAGLIPGPPAPADAEPQGLVTAAVMLSSEDGGETWTPTTPIEDAKHWLIQPCCEAVGPPGGLLALFRTGAGKAYLSRSKDAGLTWTTPSATSLANPNSKFCSLHVAGQILVVHNASAKHRTPLALSISVDEGKTWQQLAVVDDDPDVSAPSFVAWSEEEIKAVYCVSGNRLRLATVKLEVERT